MSVLDQANLTQHVTFPTHIQSHTLDLVITRTDSFLNPLITCTPTSPSDHFPIISSLNIVPLPPPPLSVHTYRSIKSINIETFKKDILASPLINNPPSTLTDLVNSYNSTLSSLLDKHAPLQSKVIHLKPDNPWFTSALNKLKLTCRHLQRSWSKSHSAEDLKLLRTATNKYHAAIVNAKRTYYSNLVSTNSTNPRKLWQTVNGLLRRKSSPVLPTHTNLLALCNSFAQFFYDKVANLHASLSSIVSNTSPHITPPHFPTTLSSFHPTTVDEVTKLLSQHPVTDCELDPIPASVLRECVTVLLPTITNIINLSLSSGVFPDQFKNCSVHPLLKKPTLDKESLSNYRPVSHLCFLSKLTERVVHTRLMHHLSSSNLLNPFQSAYVKFHST